MTLQFIKAKPFWFVYARFDFHPRLKDYVKSIPGSTWEVEKRAWRVPIECIDMITKEAKEYGFKVTPLPTGGGGESSSRQGEMGIQ